MIVGAITSGADWISHFVLPNAILRHCGVDIGKCDFFDAPHRGSRLEPRGTDLAIAFGRYCRRHNRPSLSAKRPIQLGGVIDDPPTVRITGLTARIAPLGG
jgi:hypothetical protein